MIVYRRGYKIIAGQQSMALTFLRLQAPRVFISYRREDTAQIVGRIFDRLTDEFGKSSVFIDIEDVPIGTNFREYIANVLSGCDVLLAVIGQRWMGVPQDSPRILDPNDVLRVEIETALQAGIKVIPILVDHAKMPPLEALPVSLRSLAGINAATVDAGRDFHIHMRRLIESIERHAGIGTLAKFSKSIQRHTAAYSLAAGIILAVALLGVLYPTQQIPTGSSEKDTRVAIEACNRSFNLNCAQAGGAFGSNEALAGLKGCKTGRVIQSDESWLHWKDIWTTSIYSFAPGGGGPGGGKDDEVLKVGGWGDWYFTLIRFDLPQMQYKPQFAAIALYSKDNEGASVPLAIDRIIHRWDFPKGGTLWWKDRPGHRAITTDPLPAPKREQWYVIDITALVHEWVDQKAENLGVQIRPAHDFGSFVIFASNDEPDKTKIPRLIFCG